MLLIQNADVNSEIEDHATNPRHYGTMLTAAAAEDHEKLVEVLLNRDANIDVNCGDYGTALTAATAGGHGEIVETLLNQDADVNAEYRA